MNLLQRYFRRPQTLPLRQAIFQVHLWVGLLVAIYMVIIGVSGSVLVFRQELAARAIPPHWRELNTNSPVNISSVIAGLNAVYPGARIVSITAPSSFNPTFVAVVLNHGRLAVACDPRTGSVLGPVPRPAPWLTFVQRLHETLLIRGSGRVWNGAGAAALLLLAVTGLANWWPGVQNWQKALKVNFSFGWRRINFDLHRAAGFWALLPISFWAVSGVYFAWPDEIVQQITRWSPVVSAHPPSVSATPIVGAPRPDFDALVARASIVDPRTKWSEVLFPYSRRAPLEIVVHRGTGEGREYEDTVYFDPYNGEHLATWRYGVNQSAADWFIWLQAPLHFGTSWGLVTKTLWASMGLVLPLLAATGWVMYWNRTLRHKWKRLRAN